jgi:mRNA interferase MazF
MKQVFYVPERGDVVLITLQAGQQRRTNGRRPAAVLSPQAYNGRVGLALLCPIVAELKGYPFEVRLPEGLPIPGAILADHPASLDWRALRAERLCTLPPDIQEEALGKLRTLLK